MTPAEQKKLMALELDNIRLAKRLAEIDIPIGYISKSAQTRLLKGEALHRANIRLTKSKNFNVTIYIRGEE